MRQCDSTKMHAELLDRLTTTEIRVVSAKLTKISLTVASLAYTRLGLQYDCCHPAVSEPGSSSAAVLH